MEFFRNVFLFLFLVIYGVLSEIQLPQFGFTGNSSVIANEMKQSHNIRFLGSNGNHHHSIKYIKEIKKPFVLILLDAHSDASPQQQNLNCGNWVNFAIKENPNIQKVIVFGVSKGLQFEDASEWNNYELIKSGKLVILPARKCVSYFKDKEIPQAFKGLLTNYEFDNIGKFLGSPGYYITWNDYQSSIFNLQSSIYVSIDLDVLKDVKTPYGSGIMSIDELEQLLYTLKRNGKIVGADVCGTDDKSSAVAVENIIKCLKNG
ncbi:MAG: hypothetical protein WC947_03780 [Elusimicrobiota bacterium]